MTRSRTLLMTSAMVAVALAAASTVGAAQTSRDPAIDRAPGFDVQLIRLHAFRADFNKVLDHYESVFQKLGNMRGLRLTGEARDGMSAVSDEQLEKMFAKVAVPDLGAAVQATEMLESQTPVVVPAAGPGGGPGSSSPGFPDPPSILSDCDNISHSSSFTFGALVAFQVVRTILAAAEFACEETVVVLGEGGNGSAVCIPLAIAQDVAAIPFELASFCAGEEDSAVLQGSFDRLEHIHNDLDAARTAIIDNDNSNKTEVVNLVNTKVAQILTSIDANTTQIINNDNANRDAIVMELRNLGCEIVRLLNTPEGQRASSVLACTGQRNFPYNFPEKP